MEVLNGTDVANRCDLNAEFTYPFEITGYNQHEPATCIVATTRSIINVLDPARNITAEEVDAFIGRAPEQLANIDLIHLLLLDNGARLHSICAFDDDQYARHGIAYLKEYYKIGEPDESWPATEFYAYFTPDEISRQLSELMSVVLHPNFSQLTRDPAIDDVFQAISEGKLVRIATGKPNEASGNVTTHSELVTGFSTTKTVFGASDTTNQRSPEQEKWLCQPRITLSSPSFSPDEAYAENYTVTIDNFLEFWRPADGIMVIEKAA